MATTHTDLLVIGSGLAGLAFSLKTAEHSHVTVIAKEKAQNANSSWAQGGIAAVMSEEDSFASHIQDTLVAGAGLCKLDAVQDIITQAPDRIQDLLKWGVQFDLKSANSDHIEIDLTRE